LVDKEREQGDPREESCGGKIRHFQITMSCEWNSISRGGKENRKEKGNIAGRVDKSLTLLFLGSKDYSQSRESKGGRRWSAPL